MINDTFLTQALLINVPYELFWRLNPNKLKPFKEAFKTTQNETRANLWLQGLYFKQAILSAFNNEVEYPDKPLDFNTDNNKPNEPDLELQSLKFSAWADAFNEGFIQRQEKNIDNSEGP